MAVDRQPGARKERGASSRGTEARAGARADAAAARPFVFLDKDGTLVEDVPYNVDPDLIRLAPGAGPALRALAACGYGLAVVSNQSGVARGLFPEEALVPYFARLRELLAAEAVDLDAILYCPHHRDGVNEYAIECECRKPAPGLLLRAAGDLGADLAASWIVGDILDDVEAGHRAGTSAALLDAGHETEWRAGKWRRPEIVATSLADAAERILAGTAAVPSPEPTTTGARQ